MEASGATLSTADLRRVALGYVGREFQHLSESVAAEIEALLEVADYVQVVVRLAGFSIYRDSLTTVDVDRYLGLEAAGLLWVGRPRGLFGPGDVADVTEGMRLFRDLPPGEWAADARSA
jgi:hypothetical protein